MHSVCHASQVEYDTLVALKVTEKVLPDENMFGKNYREKTKDEIPERTKAEIFALDN